MSPDTQKGYIAGMVDMLSYQFVLAGDRKHAQCVSDSFYSDEKMPGHIADVMAAFPDKDSVTVIVVVMREA